jgi:dihydroorotase/N-acyl-D-amino-acid deacylase
VELLMKILIAAAAITLLHAADFDTLIRNGRIVDGTGNPAWVGDIAIRTGRIAAMGKLGDRTAPTVIDAHGLVVTPGFIDIHNHSDYTLLVDGSAQSMVRQGVTSVILGEGDSAAPIGGKQNHTENEADWADLSGYFNRILKQGISLNVGTYVGSSQIWTYVHGMEPGPPSPAEILQMQSLTRQAIQEGAPWVSRVS